MAAVEPVRGVREQQIARALQHGLHPPAQPVPGVEGAPVAGALFPEALAVPVHPQQRGGGVDAQRVQPEPAVGHAGIEPHRRAELLLRLRVGAHRVGVHAAQPGEVGRGLRAPCVPKSITSPTNRAPVECRSGRCPSAAFVEPLCCGRELRVGAESSRPKVAPRGIVPAGWHPAEGCRTTGSSRWEQTGRTRHGDRG